MILSTLPWLKACARSHKDPAVSRSAVEELAHGWKNDLGGQAFVSQLVRVTG